MLRKPLKKIISLLSTNDYQTLNRIDLNSSAVLNNVSLIHKQHPGFDVFAVLKANAYGHGLLEMAKILNDANCAFIAVDGYFEAARIRDITKHRILVMGYIQPVNAKLLDTKRCSFVVQDINGIEALGQLNRPVTIHLEINTGMNRLGLQPDELMPYLKSLKRYPKLLLEGVMTHLADADNDQSDDYTKKQVKLFDETVRKILDNGFRPKYLHIAQTAGSTKAKSRYANAIRLGIGLYGINPLGPLDKHYQYLSGLQPVLELKSTIIKTLNINKGEKVSYNGIFKAPSTTRIGVLPLGYYEGLPRELSNIGVLTADDQKLPIVGRVCMNHTMVDLGTTNFEVGEEVTIISSNPSDPNSVSELCSSFNLFSYTLLTGLSSSVRRHIV